jgi:hypothetical protein
MGDTMSIKIKPEAYALLGIPVLIFIGSLFHFLYSISGELFVVGLFTPVNESVFEHIKMVVFPIFLWWSLFYLLRKDNLNANKWFMAALLSMLTAIISIPMLYYFYTEAFGVTFLAVDVLILLVSVGAGQLLGLHYYQYGKGIDYRLTLGLMVFIIVLFADLTIFTPKLPLFQDPIDGSYGIRKI